MASIFKKLLYVQENLGTVKKDSENPHFRSKYYDINSLIAAVKPVLTAAGLVVIQPLDSVDGKPVIRTMLFDPETGEHVDYVMPLMDASDPQKLGATISYFRRYSLASLLCLEAEDDDAESVAHPKAKDGNPVAYVKHTRAALPPKPSEPISVPVMVAKPPSEQAAVPYRPAGAKVYGTAKPYELAETKPKEEMPADWLKEDEPVTIEEAIRMMLDKTPVDEEFEKYRRMIGWNPAAKTRILEKMRSLEKWTEEQLASL